MPSAKRLVALYNLDASKITGTGLGGRIMRYDVVNFMQSNQQAANPSKSTKSTKSTSKPSKPSKPNKVTTPSILKISLK